MELSKELLYPEIGKMVFKHIESTSIDYSAIAEKKSMQALDEIKKIIHNEALNDFERVDAIVEVFVRFNIDIGGCHDF